MTKLDKFLDDGGALIVFIITAVILSVTKVIGAYFLFFIVGGLLAVAIFEHFFRKHLSRKYPILMENRHRLNILKSEIEKNPHTNFNTLCVRSLYEERE